jgi:co-chaperonin GroES (HSP10)
MFKPVNRYIQIKLPEVVAVSASGIVLPDDFKPTVERYGTATVVNFAKDVRFKDQLLDKTQVIVDKSMIEEITVNNKKINVVLDNYVVGIIK